MRLAMSGGRPPLGIGQTTGTTADAFFSLDRLARFLRDAPLDLRLALNLDGGPVACQGIALDSYRRDFCGSWSSPSAAEN